MVRRVVITNRGMVSAGAQGEVVVCSVLEQEPLQIHSDGVVQVALHYQFSEQSKFVGKTIGDEQVELPQSETIVIALQIARLILNV